MNDWTSGILTAGGFFVAANYTVLGTGSCVVGTTLRDIAPLTVTPSGSMNNLVVVFWTDTMQAQNVTLDIGKVQFGLGSVAPTFIRRHSKLETQLCNRYLRVIGDKCGVGFLLAGHTLSPTITRYIITFEGDYMLKPPGAAPYSSLADFAVDQSNTTSGATRIILSISDVSHVALQVDCVACTPYVPCMLFAQNANARIYLDSRI